MSLSLGRGSQGAEKRETRELTASQRTESRWVIGSIAPNVGESGSKAEREKKKEKDWEKEEKKSS